MAKQHTDHDKLFKSAFQDIKTVREFLENFLPTEILKEINLKKLKLDTTNYITDKMKELFSDVVFRTVFLKNKNTLILLLEHKSEIDRALIVQILKYILEILSLDIQENRPYSFVLPIIIYHGDRKSKPNPLHSYFDDLPSFLQKFIPFIDFLFVNLGTTPNELLLNLSDNTLLKSTFLALKNVADTEFIKAHFDDFVKFLEKKPNYEGFLKKIFVYLSTRSTIKKEEIELLIVSQTNKTLKMKMATAVKGIWAEAVEEGITQGITQGELKKTIEVVRKGWLKGHSIEVIADLADISIEEVKKYIYQFEKEKK